MGFVYRARQPGTDRDVAVKVLRGDQLNSLPGKVHDLQPLDADVAGLLDEDATADAELQAAAGEEN